MLRQSQARTMLPLSRLYVGCQHPLSAAACLFIAESTCSAVKPSQLPIGPEIPPYALQD